MSADKVADAFRQAPGTEPSVLPEGSVRVERRREPRVPPKSVEDAHVIVKAIAKRRIDNDSSFQKWRSLERGVYLFGLVGAFLLYYLIDKMKEAISLPGLGF